MKKSMIQVGKSYSNGKGRIRRVCDLGDYPLYSGQTDHDCVKYVIVNDGTKKNHTCGTIGVMTKTSFAAWAKMEAHDAD